jgi:hypothetical protein
MSFIRLTWDSRTQARTGTHRVAHDGFDLLRTWQGKTLPAALPAARRADHRNLEMAWGGLRAGVLPAGRARRLPPRRAWQPLRISRKRTQKSVKRVWASPERRTLIGGRLISGRVPEPAGRGPEGLTLRVANERGGFSSQEGEEEAGPPAGFEAERGVW